ncbi:MAG: acetoacetate--CoA ligase [Solirubrobacterales bacterium]|nr:acetoacetate--CoA ligase [Solirubrobacterales bacterium]
MEQAASTLWRPGAGLKEHSRLNGFMATAAEHGGPRPGSGYLDLHQWSIENPATFWEAVADHFKLDLSGAERTISDHGMPGTRWFEGATVSYPAQIFRDRPADQAALLFKTEDRPPATVTWGELEARTAKVREFLAEQGVGRGDTVAGYLHNGPEAVIAFLATASLGAIWSSCSPDFGPAAAIDRLGQIGPKVLFAVDGYQYGGRTFSRTETVELLAEAMPSLVRTVLVRPPQIPDGSPPPAVGPVAWEEIQARPESKLEFERVPFDHPLWVLYSSGTTGLPKGLVHSHGGILLEHLKWVGLQCDLGPEDRLLWMTTTGWTMWNFLVGGLLVGAGIVLYDGSLGYPDLNALWDLAAESGATCMGAGAGFYTTCRRAGIEPKELDLSRLRAVGSTGSPLQPEDFDWIYEQLGDVWLFSTSGGTDVCTAFVGGSILMPVIRGEIQAPALGVDVQAWDEEGRRLPAGEVGELVVTQPMPSMPVRLWGDDGSRYRDSYFDRYPGVWRHGDWIEMRESGGAVIHGRSDSTINRGGVRIGTAEIYRAVLDVDEVADAVVVDLPRPGRESEVLLFVQPAPGAAIDEESQRRIAGGIRSGCSPRHVPDRILEVPAVPRTISGKVVETPLRKILQGEPVEAVVSADSLSDPGSIDWFVAFEQSGGAG